MRGWGLVVGSTLLIAAAWALGRFVHAARIEALTFPGQFELYLGADLAARVLFAIIAVGLGWLSLDRRGARVAGVAMLALGLYFALIETLIGFLPRGLLMPFALDAFESYFLGWAGTVVALLGLLVAASPVSHRASPSAPVGPARHWWPLIGSVVLIALSYPVGDFVSDVRNELAREVTPGPFLIGTAVRFATVGALIGIGWLVLRGPRSRVVGALMLGVGAYIAVVVPVAAAWYFMGDPAAGDIREPIQIPLGYDSGGFPPAVRSPVSATVIAVLGVAAMISGRFAWAERGCPPLPPPRRWPRR